MGVAFSLSDALEAEILCFLGQPGSRSDFGTKCSRISGCLGWLKQWFGARGVVKITLSPKLEFLRFGASFGGHFGSRNDKKVDMWLTLGHQCGKVGGPVERDSRFFAVAIPFRHFPSKTCNLQSHTVKCLPHS